LLGIRTGDALARASPGLTMPTGDQPTTNESVNLRQTGAGTDRCPSVHRQSVHRPYTVRTPLYTPAVQTCCTPLGTLCRTDLLYTVGYTGRTPAVHRPYTVGTPTTDGCAPSVHRWYTDHRRLFPPYTVGTSDHRRLFPAVHRWYFREFWPLLTLSCIRRLCSGWHCLAVVDSRKRIIDNNASQWPLHSRLRRWPRTVPRPPAHPSYVVGTGAGTDSSCTVPNVTRHTRARTAVVHSVGYRQLLPFVHCDGPDTDWPFLLVRPC